MHPTLYTENFPVTPYRIGMPESQWQSVPNSSPVWVEYESRAEAEKLRLNYVLFQESMEQFSLCKPNSLGIASTYDLCVSQKSAILSNKPFSPLGQIVR